MIRGFFILIGLLMGLLLAVITEARMHHLRNLAGRIDMPLPAWSNILASDAGLLMGQISGANTLLGLQAPSFDLGWQFQGLSQKGLRYGVTLKDDGIALQGNLFVPFFGSKTDLTELRGTVDITQLLPMTDALDWPLSGQIQIDGLMMQLDYKQRQLLALSGETTLHHLRFDGTDLGPARLELNPVDVGNWQAKINMGTGPLHLQGQMSGVLGQSAAKLDGVITQGKEMPESWQRWLNQSLPRVNGGWKLGNSLELKGLSLEN